MLGAMKTAPTEAELSRPVLDVEVIRAQPEDVPVVIHGFGKVKPVTVLPVTARTGTIGTLSCSTNSSASFTCRSILKGS